MTEQAVTHTPVLHTSVLYDVRVTGNRYDGWLSIEFVFTSAVR